MRRLVFFFAPFGVPLSFGWICVLYVLSEQTGIPRPPLFPGDDKVVHFLLYAPIGLGMFLGLVHSAPGENGYLQQIVMTTGILIFAAVFDEAHQGLVPGRTPDMWDLAADILGGRGRGMGRFALFKETIANRMTPGLRH